MSRFVCVKCGLTKDEPFTWGHKPLNSDIRTCCGKVIEQEDYEPQVCPLCEGTGTDGRTPRKCYACGGSGKYERATS